MTLWAPLVILGLAAALVFAYSRFKGDFQIILSKGDVRFRGKFPPHRKADTVNFLLHELALTGRVRIIDTWSARRVLRIDVSGAPQSQQRIRNFLKTTLGG